MSESQINSKEYWDERFGSGDWEEKQGREQSTFFYCVAKELLPQWFLDDVRENRLSVCDLGCAEGEGVDILGGLFPHSRMIGSDVSDAALERARNYYPQYEFVQADINNLPFDADVMFTSNTLEHFHEPDSIIENVLPHCGKYFVMLIPFRELERIDEHFYTFDYDSFPLNRGKFSIVFYKEIDCTEMEGTQWPGPEILVIYQKSGTPGFAERTLAHLQNGRWEEYNQIRKELYGGEGLIREYVEALHEREREVARLNNQLEEDRNAILQIQFEAAQHKLAELASRETYIWRTGVRIEALLKRTGVAFIRSLLVLADFKRAGLILTVRKGWNECFHRVNTKRNKKLLLRQCRNKFRRFKQRREEDAHIDLTHLRCPRAERLVSIVMPVLNGEYVIREAIDSVLAQTYGNFELIIINDGSTDRTPEIIEEYAKRDARIHVYHQENRKLPRTLTRGFELARGEFYTWTSADNVMLPDCIEILVKELRAHPEQGMVYGNIRLINARGKIKRGHFWYEQPFFSGNVNLPLSAEALNTYANNTVGAAFLYRAEVGQTLGSYSRYKHTLEDYDYWMRLNSLFSMRHTDEKKALYQYRWHDESLTAHDKELGITKNRYKLMALDDFRRDFYLSALVWVVEAENENQAEYAEFKTALQAAGQRLLDRRQALSYTLPEIEPNVVYVYFGDHPQESVSPMRRFSAAAWVSGAVQESGAEWFDVCVTTDEKARLPLLEYGKGWFAVGGGRNIYAFLDSKIKNDILYRMEGMIENTPVCERKISIIICTYKRGEKLIDALWSVLRQSFGKRDYEILIVDNDPFESGIENEILSFAEKYAEYGEFVRYIGVPQKGLSYARNAGMWNARGDILLFLDDDVLADYYLLEEIYTAFKYHPDAGVIGGQIILDVPFPRPEVVRKGWESLWSQFTVVDSVYKDVTQQFEFPYGANFAVRRKALMQIGGFRMCYGRVGNDFAGGEETAVAFLMRKIGYTVGIQPRAKVLHRVDHDRFTREHVKKTIRAGILTSYRFFTDLHTSVGWTRKYVQSQINITRRELQRFIRKQVDPMDIFHKRCTLAAWQEMLRQIDADAEETQE